VAIISVGRNCCQQFFTLIKVPEQTENLIFRIPAHDDVNSLGACNLKCFYFPFTLLRCYFCIPFINFVFKLAGRNVGLFYELPELFYIIFWSEMEYGVKVSL